MIRKLKYFLLPLIFLVFALPVVAQTSTPDAETIRDRVRERVEQLAKRPRAYVGKIVDLPDSIIEIKTVGGETKQAKTDEDTVFIRTVRGGRREITFGDLVVEDWVIAMGYLTDNNVLEAKRVLTMSTSPITTRRAVYGVVQEVEDGTFKIKHPKKDEVWTVKTSRDTRVTTKSDTRIVKGDVDDIDVGERIIAAGTPSEENTIEARLIHIIPGKAEGL